MEHRRLAGVQRLRVVNLRDHPLEPVSDVVHLLDAAFVPGQLAHQLIHQPRLAHLLDAVRAVALVVAQPPRRYLQALLLQRLAGLLHVLAHR